MDSPPVPRVCCTDPERSSSSGSSQHEEAFAAMPAKAESGPSLCIPILGANVPTEQSCSAIAAIARQRPACTWPWPRWVWVLLGSLLGVALVGSIIAIVSATSRNNAVSYSPDATNAPPGPSPALDLYQQGCSYYMRIGSNSSGLGSNSNSSPFR